jgi:hypothetical protein
MTAFVTIQAANGLSMTIFTAFITVVASTEKGGCIIYFSGNNISVESKLTRQEFLALIGIAG